MLEEASNQAMQLTASKPAVYAFVSAVGSVFCVACTEGSRQLILCLVRPMRATLALLLLTAVSALAEGRYTQEMFRRAMSKDNMAVSGVMSDAPLFTLIHVRDPRTGAQRETCVLSSFLSGAIHMEHRLPYDNAGLRRSFEIAMAQPDRVFTFRRRDARRNVQPHYTAEQLAEVRQRLRRKSAAQLRREVGRPGSEVTLLSERPYRPGRNTWVDGWITVVAHVLLERGILVGSTHWGPSLYLDKKA
jgi:hypothetical protein